MTTEIQGDLILEADYKINDNLIVHGDIKGKDRIRHSINAWNIDAWNIDAWNIDAWNIDAWDIICEKRIKKDKEKKTICRIFIENKSKIEREEKLKGDKE